MDAGKAILRKEVGLTIYFIEVALQFFAFSIL
jgi:hypothetical protein